MLCIYHTFAASIFASYYLYPYGLLPLHNKHFNRKGVVKIKLHYNPIFSLFIFPHAGPDIKYLLGFIRTQLSTSTTIALVFGPKVVRVLRGQGDQWDNRAKVRGITASFSLNGIGLVQEDSPDLYQENEELKVDFHFIRISFNWGRT